MAKTINASCLLCNESHEIPHIRVRLPRKGGNSFYRDKNNYTIFCVTLCGAPITDKDIDYATANTKKFRARGWLVCVACLAKQDELQAAIIAALPDAYPSVQAPNEYAIISADGVEYGILDGNTIKVRS